jgi:hypothetical protein
MTRLQLEPFEIYRGFKFGPADVEIRRVMSQRLPQIMSAFIRTDEYKNLDSDERKTIEFIRYAKEQIGEILRKPRRGGEAPVLEVLEARVRQLEEQGASQDAIKEELGYHRNDINQFLYENSQKRIRRAVEEELGAPTDESNFAEYYARAQDLTKQKFATGGMPTSMDEQMDALSLSETETAGEEPQSLSGVIGKIAEVGGEVWDNMNYLDRAALVTAPVPVVGDVTGLLADAYMYATKPEERTATNYALTGGSLALGLPASVTSAIGSSPALLGIFGAARRNPEALKRYEEAMNAPLTKEQEKLIADDPDAIAKIMEEKAERIRQETGVGVLEGADPTPRFEIDDSKAKIKNIEVAEFQGISSDGLGEPYKQLVTKSGSPIGGGLSNLTIGDILEHDEFFKYYPEARDLPITYAGDGYKGAFIYGTDRTDPLGSGAKMELSSDVDPESFLSPLADLRETVLHELQHYVQFVDNLNMGGSSKTFMPGGNTFGMARLGEEIDTKLDGVYRAITNRQDELMPEIFDLIVAGLGSPNAKTVANAENIAKNNKITEDEMIVIRHLADLKKDFNKIETEAYMNYRTLSGEIEARLISEQRRAMTPKERLAQRPSLPERLLAEETLGMKEGRYPVKNNPVVLAMEEGSVNKEYISRLGMMRDQATKLISRMKGSEFFDFNDDGGFKLLDSIEINIDNSISNVIDKAKDKGFVNPASETKITKNKSSALWDAPDQQITSADTSINKEKLPAGYGKLKKLGVFKPGQRVVDIGGGRFDNAVEDLAKQDVELLVYDPFNRTPEHNKAVADVIADGGADVAVSNNVLNVIEEPENIKRVIEQAENAIKPGDKAYFTVYAGNRSGKGAQTTKGYQRNEPTSDYVSRVEEVFGKGNVQIKGDLITATKNDAGLPLEDAAKKYSPSDLGMSGDKTFYHGTTGDLGGFDLKKSDLGIHIGGNPKQAMLRLKAKGNLPKDLDIDEYPEGANIIPLVARIKNPLETTDLGHWNDVLTVLRGPNPLYKQQQMNSYRNEIAQGKYINPKILADGITDIAVKKGFKKENIKKLIDIEDEVWKIADKNDWKGPLPYKIPDDLMTQAKFAQSPRSKELLAEIREILADEGYDSIKYENLHERGTPSPDDDLFSYIVLDTSQLRVPWAKFDPKNKSSGELNKNRGGLMSRK